MKNSYPVLITDAFILHTRSVGEADRIITMFTRDNQVISVYARSIRREKAKMRGAVKPYGKVSFSAVLGKRATLKDITVIDTLDAIWSDEIKYTAFVTFLQHIRALVPVAEPCDDNLFTITETFVDFLQRSAPMHAENTLLVGQVMFLNALGYISDSTIVPEYFWDVLREVSSSPERRKELLDSLQNALRHQ